MKRLTSLSGLLAAALLAVFPAFISGCAAEGPENVPSQDVRSMPTLKYYTIGNPDPDLPRVNQELNVLLAEKLGIQIEYNRIPWEDYGGFISTLINSGSDFDICFAAAGAHGDYTGNAQRGAWLPLNDYLLTEGRDMHEAVDPLFWKGAVVDGAVYGVPTNKELAVPTRWIYAEELVERYNVDITKLTTLESLGPLMQTIKDKEPDYLPMELSADASNFFALEGYEYLTDYTLPLMVLSDDTSLELVNIYDTALAEDTLQTLHEYYGAGYINTDAALRKSQSLTEGKKVFWFAASGGPFSESSWSRDRGYPLVSQLASGSFVNTESIRGGLMVINAHTSHPTESVRFLNLLNTDSEVRNLLNYGIEDVHYTLTEDDQVEIISSAYSGVQYTQGNWFILKTRVGDPLDKWEQYRAFNESAVKSVTLGFAPDFSEDLLEEIAQQVRAVTKKYYAPLMTGTVDPAVVLPEFRKELRDADIEFLRTALQRQLRTWAHTNTE